jgi:hypothetical protein
VDDQGIISGALFGEEDLSDGVLVEGIGSQAVDGLGGKSDEPSGADDGRGAGDMLFGGGEDLCAHGLYYTQTSPGPYIFASQWLAKANSPDEVWPGEAWGEAWSADLHLPVAEADTADLDASVSP